jgi:hypothetical protein
MNILILCLLIFVQEPAESVEKLRSQLLDVQAQEETLRARAQQLEEALKPENIERSLAGIGSTKPEELRESRRRQLTIERDGVLAQLKLLETSRTRLERSLADAEARAYQQSARQTPPTNQALMAQSPSSTRWLILGAGFAGMAFVIAIVLYQKVRYRQR